MSEIAYKLPKYPASVVDERERQRKKDVKCDHMISLLGNDKLKST